MQIASKVYTNVLKFSAKSFIKPTEIGRDAEIPVYINRNIGPPTKNISQHEFPGFFGQSTASGISIDKISRQIRPEKGIASENVNSRIGPSDALAGTARCRLRFLSGEHRAGLCKA